MAPSLQHTVCPARNICNMWYLASGTYSRTAYPQHTWFLIRRARSHTLRARARRTDVMPHNCHAAHYTQSRQIQHPCALNRCISRPSQPILLAGCHCQTYHRHPPNTRHSQLRPSASPHTSRFNQPATHTCKRSELKHDHEHGETCLCAGKEGASAPILNLKR